MIRRLLLLSILAGPFMGPLHAESRRISLNEALQLAEASPLLRTLALEVDRAGAEVRATGLRSNPEIFFSREEAAGVVDRFATISFTTPLTSRLSLERDAARKGVEAAEARAGQERLGLRARVEEVFLDLLAAQERQVTLSGGLSDLVELVEILRLREREGDASGFDRMRAERERADVEVGVLSSRGDLARARETLASLTGLPSGDVIAEGSLASTNPLPEREVIARLTASRGDVAGFERDAERAESLIAASQRRAVPELSLAAGAKTTEMDGTTGTGAVASIAFTVPLFDRGQGGRGVALAERAVARERHAAAARLAAGEAEAALAEAAARREAEDAYAAAGDPRELARIARASYEAGEMRILELLDAYRTALTVRLRTIDLHVEARRAEIELNVALGAEVAR
jgi:outer membrane protein, heavy metal efflux system